MIDPRHHIVHSPRAKLNIFLNVIHRLKFHQSSESLPVRQALHHSQTMSKCFADCISVLELAFALNMSWIEFEAWGQTFEEIGSLRDGMLKKVLTCVVDYCCKYLNNLWKLFFNFFLELF
jgi:hypothetical protein